MELHLSLSFGVGTIIFCQNIHKVVVKLKTLNGITGIISIRGRNPFQLNSKMKRGIIIKQVMCKYYKSQTIMIKKSPRRVL